MNRAQSKNDLHGDPLPAGGRLRTRASMACATLLILETR
jgi:hypothetical protein